MQRFVTKLSAEEYTAEMRRRVRLFPTWEGDCFSGLVIGRCFSVAYRTYYEWDRRTSYACGRAMGFVCEKDGKTVVSYVTTRGPFSPFWICFFTLIFFVPVFFSLQGNLIWMTLLSLIFSTLLCAAAAFFESLTESSEEAARTITRFVMEPHTFLGHEKSH